MLPVTINYILCLYYFVFYQVVKKQIYKIMQNMSFSGVQTCLDGTLTAISKKLFVICIFKTHQTYIYEFICIKSPFHYFVWEAPFLYWQFPGSNESYTP